MFKSWVWAICLVSLWCSGIGAQALVFVSQPQSTPHPYQDNMNVTYTYTQPNATGMKVRFSNFNTEQGYDYVYILDKNNVRQATYHGSLGAFDSVLVQGDTIKVQFTSDSSITKNGFDMTGYLYTNQDLPPAPPTAFNASTSGQTVSLSWVNPTDSDFASVTIRRSTQGYPQTAQEGDMVATGIAATSFVDPNLANGMYYYSIFSLDMGGNVSTRATANVSVDGFLVVSQVQSTPHPYQNNMNVTYTYTKPNATGMKVRFSNFNTEQGYDYVYILDKNNVRQATYHGVLGTFDSVIVLGDTIKIQFTSDSSQTRYGFDVLTYSYTTAPDIAAPTSPNILASKATPTGNMTTLTWSVPTATATFRLERSYNSGAYTVVANNIPAATLSRVDSGLGEGNYTYRLYAINTYGNASVAGTSNTVTIDTTPPGAPTLTGTKNTPTGNTIALSWTVPATTASFRLERAKDGGSYSIVSQNMAANRTSFGESSLSDGVYVYRLYALDSFGNTSVGATTNALTIDTTPPGAPTLTGTKNTPTGNTIALSWTVPATTASFRLERAKDGGSYSIVSQNMAANMTSFGESSLSDGVYVYRLYAIDSFGNLSVAGTSEALTIDTTPPAAPTVTGIKTTPTGNTVSLSWTVPATTAYFRLERSKDGADYSVVHAAIDAATTAFATSLSHGVYIYRLFAIDSFGNISLSSTTEPLTIVTTAGNTPGGNTGGSSGGGSGGSSGGSSGGNSGGSSGTPGNAVIPIGGTVAAINEVFVQDYGLATGVWGGQFVGNQAVPMIRFVLYNNNPSGFYVNFSSQNQGYLVAADNSAERVAYHISTQLETPSGLGTDKPQDILGESLMQTLQLVFSTNVRRATYNCAYILSVAPAATLDQTTLYKDVLTITIHNL